MQLSGFPLVKVFEVYDKIYIYDARSNFLCELMPDDLYRLINFAQCKINPFSELWQKNAFLLNDLENVICSKKEIFEVIDEHFKYVLPRKLVLEITENCNLRCSYCFNTLGTGHRVHSKKQMTKPVIYKAIDQYFKVYTEIFSKIPDTEKNNYLKVAVPNCNWWGGEPFLNFELIKDSLLYFKNLPWNKYGIPSDKLSYCVVTNFTILNQDILDFLIENHVLLMISLDGDQNEHDKNRKFLDGSGSFEIVKRNLDHILTKYPEYCKNNVLIQAVFSKGNKKIADKDSFFRQYFYTKDGEMKVLRIGQYPK